MCGGGGKVGVGGGVMCVCVEGVEGVICVCVEGGWGVNVCIICVGKRWNGGVVWNGGCIVCGGGGGGVGEVQKKR